MAICAGWQLIRGRRGVVIRACYDGKEEGREEEKTFDHFLLRKDGCVLHGCEYRGFVALLVIRTTYSKREVVLKRMVKSSQRLEHISDTKVITGNLYACIYCLIKQVIRDTTPISNQTTARADLSDKFQPSTHPETSREYSTVA